VLRKLWRLAYGALRKAVYRQKLQDFLKPKALPDSSFQEDSDGILDFLNCLQNWLQRIDFRKEVAKSSENSVSRSRQKARGS